MDPDIPNYESQVEDPLPVVVIKSADHLFLREVTLRVNISSKSDRMPQSLYLCYDKDSDKPDTTNLKIDLLPLYKKGEIDVKLTNLQPSTTYYCRVYAETRGDSGYSDLFKFCTATSDTDIAWKKVTDFPNKKMLYTTAFSIGEDLYFLENEIYHNISLGGTQLWKFSPSTGTWEKFTEFPAGKRCNPIVYVIKNQMYMGFGWVNKKEGQSEIKSDIWNYNLSSQTWQMLHESPGGYSALMSSFVHKGKGYLVSTGAMWQQFPMEVFCFDPELNKWIRRSDFPGEKVNNTLTLVVKDRVFIVGGSFAYGSDPLYSNCLWEYVPETDSWFRRADFPGGIRSEMQGFVIGDRMFAGFGYENTSGDVLHYVSDLWEYIPEKDVWEARSAFTLWKPNELTVSIDTDQAGYVGSVKDGLWRYLPEKDR